MSFAARPRLLILGSGFASFRLLKQIDLRLYDVTMISRRNHFLYTPLLPSTTVGTVEFRTIIEPVRRSRCGIHFLQADAEEIDTAGRQVICRSVDRDRTFACSFDYLAIGVGADINTFGVPGVREHACFLKELSDARNIRERLIAGLERACLPGLPEEERRKLTHFVGIGAGPTGVRFAAELHDLLCKDLHRSYPELKGQVRITLLEAGKTMLGAYDEYLREFTAHQFRRRNIDVRLESKVAEVGPGFVRLDGGEIIPAGVILWSTGFAATPFVASLPFEKERGRLVTDDYLQVPGQTNIWAFGDCACPRGRNLPQLAQVAEQQGLYTARRLNRGSTRSLMGQGSPFIWKNLGISSYIGGSAAVAESAGKRRFAGFLAYQLWRSAIFTQLVSPKNKVLVPLDRLRAAIFGRELSKF
jgi:NADH:ubiquinone reductase (non-electrogenic)